MNPERHHFENRWPQLTEAEEKLHKLLIPEFEKERIDPKDFIDLYGEETVSRDLKEVKRLKAIFEIEKRSSLENTELAKRGELFEAIIGNQIDSSNWLGENASFIRTSEVDDYANGVDGVVEFEEETSQSHLALAADVTKSTRHLEKKFAAIRTSIESGELSRVKYLITSHDFRGELSNIPRVVVGADERTMREVSEVLLEFKTLQKGLAHKSAELSPKATASLRQRVKESRERLASNPLQVKLILEIQTQLEAFRHYAEKIGQPNVAKKYERMLPVIHDIMEEKKYIPRDELETDEVYRMITEKAQEFKEYGL